MEDISTYTTEKLKSLAYDQLLLIQTYQNNLGVINKELERRAAQPAETPVTPSESKKK